MLAEYPPEEPLQERTLSRYPRFAGVSAYRSTLDARRGIQPVDEPHPMQLRATRLQHRSDRPQHAGRAPSPPGSLDCMDSRHLTPFPPKNTAAPIDKATGSQWNV